MPDTAGTASADRFEDAYRLLVGEDADERACAAIPDSACTNLPRNYVLHAVNGAFSKLAEQVAGPNLVIPWLMAALGVPAVMVGLTMPIKQFGSLMPQLAVAGYIRTLARRKWVWAGGGLVQALTLVGMALAALTLAPMAAGAVVLVMLLIFSLASGTASVAFQDVSGKTVPKGQRGRMLGHRATLGGVLVIAAGAGLYFGLGRGAEAVAYSALLIFGAVLWLAAAVTYAAVSEHAGATGGGRTLWRSLGEGVAVFRRQPGFRRFLGARALLLVVEVSMPFYALHAEALFGGSLPALGVFVITVGLANVLSSNVWGRFADRSARGTLVVAGLMATATALAALVIAALPEAARSPYLYALVFLLLGFAEQGVRLGRKTYLVDAAPKDERPLYVAFSNTFVGLFALVVGLLGLVADAFSPAALIGVLAALGVLGAMAALWTPQANDMVH